MTARPVTSSLDNLANELIIAVFSFLDIRKLSLVRSVCISFKALAEQDLAKRAQDALGPSSRLRMIMEIGEPHKASTGTLLKLNAHPASTLKALVADHINKEHHVWYDFVKSDAGDSIARFSNALYPGSLVQLMMHANLVETREGERSGLIGILPVIPSTCVRIKSSSVDMMIGDFGHLSIPGEAELIYELAKKEYQDGRTYYTIAVWLLWLLKM